MWPIPRVWALRNTLEAILKPGIPHQSFLGTCNRHRSLMWSMPPRHPDGNPCAEAMTVSWPPAIQGLRLDGDLQRMINEETEAIDVLFPLEKACVCMAKKKNNIALDHVMFLGKFAFLRAHNKPFCWFFGVFFLQKKRKTTLLRLLAGWILIFGMVKSGCLVFQILEWFWRIKSDPSDSYLRVAYPPANKASTGKEKFVSPTNY